MSKYIDAEKLLNRIEEQELLAREPAAKRIIEYINQAADKEVAPVVHGEWLNYYGDFETAECSVCGKQQEVSDEVDAELFDCFKNEYRYCPNCGAKMDEG